MSRAEVLTRVGLALLLIATTCAVAWFREKSRPPYTGKRKRQYWAVVLGIILLLGTALPEKPIDGSQAYILGRSLGKIIMLLLSIRLVAWGMKGRKV